MSISSAASLTEPPSRRPRLATRSSLSSSAGLQGCGRNSRSSGSNIKRQADDVPGSPQDCALQSARKLLEPDYLSISSVVVARSADNGMEQRHTIGGRRLRGLAIELVVEDRAHRAVGQRSDLNRPRGGGFEAFGTERSHQSDDAEAGAEAPLGVGPALKDQLAQRGGCGADRSTT